MLKKEICNVNIRFYSLNDLVKYGADQVNYIHLQDYSSNAADLFVSATMSRGKLWKSSGLDQSLLDFAIPSFYDTNGRRGVWYYGDSAYAKKSISGHFIPDSHCFRRLAIFASLNRTEILSGKKF